MRRSACGHRCPCLRDRIAITFSFELMDLRGEGEGSVPADGR